MFLCLPVHGRRYNLQRKNSEVAFVVQNEDERIYSALGWNFMTYLSYNIALHYR